MNAIQKIRTFNSRSHFENRLALYTADSGEIALEVQAHDDSVRSTVWMDLNQQVDLLLYLLKFTGHNYPDPNFKDTISQLPDDEFNQLCEVVAIERAARGLKKDLDQYLADLAEEKEYEGPRYRIRYYDKDQGSCQNYFTDARDKMQARQIYENQGPGILPIVEIKKVSGGGEDV